MAVGLLHDDPDCLLRVTGGRLVEILRDGPEDVVVHSLGFDRDDDVAGFVQPSNVESVLVRDVDVRYGLGDVAGRIVRVRLFDVAPTDLDGEEPTDFGDELAVETEYRM